MKTPLVVKAPLAALMLTLLVFSALPASARGEEKEHAEHKKGGGESFLQMKQLTAAMRRPSGRNGILSVETGIDVPDNALRRRATLCMPRLRDAYVQFMLNYAASLPPGQAPDPQQIAASLQHATDRVLGKPGAKVLIGTMLIN